MCERSFRTATAADLTLIEAASGDFFDDLERHIAAGEIVITERSGEPVAFGISVPGALNDGVASIGMFTIEAHRRTGAGTATINPDRVVLRNMTRADLESAPSFRSDGQTSSSSTAPASK